MNHSINCPWHGVDMDNDLACDQMDDTPCNCKFDKIASDKTETKKLVGTIDLTPTGRYPGISWKAAAQIYIMAVENGTAEGKKAGRAGIMEMAEHLDRINTENKGSQENDCNNRTIEHGAFT